MQFVRIAANLLARQEVKYVCVGCIALAVDLSAFASFVRIGLPSVLAAACAYVVAGCVHFSASRAWTFRAFHRAAVTQLRSYLLVVGTAWAVTIGVVAIGTGAAHLSPIEAKLLAVGFTLPIGFVGHKYLTYAYGLRAALQRVAKHVTATLLETGYARNGGKH